MAQRYRLVEEVGHGGMAVVWRGVDESLERDVAVKLLHPHLAARLEHRRRLAREAKAVARLHHPNILEIYDFSGEESDEAYLVTELIRGRTLKAFAEAHPFDPPELAAACTWVLAAALAHAHGQGIVHRDLKPDNVMIREDGPAPVLKLMDFGIAQIVDRDERMTVTGSLIGSPAHMAPEIIDGEEADARSDLFSLGTILYWLATGQLPFEAPSPGALLKRIVDGDYRDVRELAPAVPDSLARIVQGLLAKRPERIASAGELMARLEKSLAESGFERPEELVVSFLASPETAAREAKRRVVGRLMQDGEAAAKARKTAKALSAYARVIAIAPGTPEAGEARAAVDRLKSRARWRQRGGLVLALAVVALAVVPLEHRFFPPAPEGVPAPEPRIAAPKVVVPPPPVPATVAPKVQAPPPPPPKIEKPPSPKLEAKLVPKVTRPLATVVRGPAVVPAKAHVKLQVLPFARISVDGQVVGQTRAWEGDLAPGPHRVELAHACCETMLLDAELEPGETKEFREKLVPKPATLALTVHGPKDAGILLDDVFEHYLHELPGGRLAVRMGEDAAGQWRYDREVRVRLFAKGYADWVQTVTVRAGQQQPLDVTMTP